MPANPANTLRTLARHVLVGFALTIFVSVLGYVSCSESAHPWARWMRTPTSPPVSGVVVHPDLLTFRPWWAARFLLSDTYFCTEAGPGVSARFTGDEAQFTASTASPTAPPAWTEVAVANPANAPKRLPSRILRVGWPMRSFQASSDSTVIARQGVASVSEKTQGIEFYAIAQAFHSYGKFRGADSGAMVLPVSPRWPGLIVDTLAWGCVSLALTAVYRAIRRGRAGAHVCSVCGYALSGLPRDAACPECGTHQGTTAGGH